MQPSTDQNRTDALGNHRDVFNLNLIRALNVLNKGFNISNRCTQTRTVTTFSWAVAMTACIPSKIRKVIQTQFIGDTHHALRVLMSTVKQHNGFVRRTRDSGAIAIKQFCTIVGDEGFL